MLATKFDIAKIGDDVLNLSTTHAIIEQHLVDTKSEIPLSQNNCSNSACDTEELCDNTFIIPITTGKPKFPDGFNFFYGSCVNCHGKCIFYGTQNTHRENM